MLAKVSLVSSRGIFVNNESTSKLPITKELSSSSISFAKKVYLTVNSLDVTQLILGTKKFAILYNGYPIVGTMCPNGEYLSNMFQCTLQRSCKIPDL